MQLADAVGVDRTTMSFQSSSGQKAGCNLRAMPDVWHLSVVSILIRPEGRMQQRSRWAAQDGGWCSFNPHPARRPDATDITYTPAQYALKVSILIRPEGRMQPLHRMEIYIMPKRVSILIRPEGRMQLH